MANLNLSLTPWQEQVFQDEARFKVVAAGRRCGKSHLAAVSLIVNALNGKSGKVFSISNRSSSSNISLFEIARSLALSNKSELYSFNSFNNI